MRGALAALFMLAALLAVCLAAALFIFAERLARGPRRRGKPRSGDPPLP